MSNKIQGYVWDACAASGVKGTKLMVMVRLADFSNDEGVSFPSVETLSRQIGAGTSTIRAACNELENEGWLVKKTRRKGNRNASNLYYLNVNKLESIAFEQIFKLKKQRENRTKFQHPESDGSKFDPLNSGCSERFDPPESGNKYGFHPPESGGDPSVNSKHDPSVNSKHDPSVECEQNLGGKFNPLLAKPSNVSKDVWRDWVTFRKEIKKPLTETMCKRQANKLASCPDPDAVLCNSIANGWQGLFPEKTNKQATPENKQNSHVGFNKKTYETMMNWTIRQDHGK